MWTGQCETVDSTVQNLVQHLGWPCEHGSTRLTLLTSRGWRQQHTGPGDRDAHTRTGHTQQAHRGCMPTNAVPQQVRIKPHNCRHTKRCSKGKPEQRGSKQARNTPWAPKARFDTLLLRDKRPHKRTWTTWGRHKLHTRAPTHQLCLQQLQLQPRRQARLTWLNDEGARHSAAQRADDTKKT